MTTELQALLLTAASVGFFHTLLGPDHYIPFIALARARRWSLTRTGLVTFLCGLGHIGSSVLLGSLGVAFGIAVSRVTALEALRGNIAGWLLIAFGLAYFAWGLRRALRNRPHTHRHVHFDLTDHDHRHVHAAEHVHVHETAGAPTTPWVLFLVFVFGPCEPLIPLLMYPAARGGLAQVVVVTAVFGLATIATMLAVVIAGALGLRFMPLGRLERYSHALAGAMVLACGVAVQFVGL